MHTLKIKILDTCPNADFVADYYQNKVNNIGYNGDCGVDLIFPEDVELPANKVTKCNLGIACEFIPQGETTSSAFDLVPRSSIANTPLMLANSIGIFDPEYRGPVIVAMRCFDDYLVKKGDRLVQILAPDRKPIRVELVDKLSDTKRGNKGFGSTNQ